MIIGAITDPQLDGKMRVSIVATSLDGQQPETKSVINMVHRIQNRNPGYSDFSGINMSDSFNFQSSSNTPISDGATALKLENEVQADNDVGLNTSQYSENINESTVKVDGEMNQEFLKNETNEIEKNDNVEIEPSNGLENFGLQEEGSFELFDNNSTQNNIDEDKEEVEEDELEIPAFLRRQKN